MLMVSIVFSSTFIMKVYLKFIQYDVA
jgi:hypothetical protein